VLVTASPEVRSHVEGRGGSVYVRCRRNRGCRGVSFLEVTTEAPATVEDYQLFVVDGMMVYARLPGRARPDELRITLAGRRRPHPVASWDGCAFVL
jgi:hypothetical protein